MLDATRARLCFGATALLVVVGIVIQVPVAVNAKHGFFNGAAAGLNVFAFFTIQSNLIIGATCLLLAWNLDRTSTVFKVFRLIGVVAIAVTGVVYHVALAGMFDLDSWALTADMILHTIVPVVAVFGWLAYGPRGRTSRRVARYALLFPLAYTVFTAIRGAVVGFYPYPFADVNALGYARVIINSGWLTLIFYALAAGADTVDTILARRTTAASRVPWIWRSRASTSPERRCARSATTAVEERNEGWPRARRVAPRRSWASRRFIRWPGSRSSRQCCTCSMRGSSHAAIAERQSRARSWLLRVGSSWPAASAVPPWQVAPREEPALSQDRLDRTAGRKSSPVEDR